MLEGASRRCHKGRMLNAEFGIRDLPLLDIWRVRSGIAIRGVELVWRNARFAIRGGGMEEAPNYAFRWLPLARKSLTECL